MPVASPIKRYAKLVAISVTAVVAIFIVAAANTDHSFHHDMGTANEKSNSNDQRLIDEAKQKDETTTTPPQAEAQAPTAYLQSRAELVDGDPVMSSLDSRFPELSLRKSSSSAHDDYIESNLRLAWMTNQISFEDYEYAKTFLRDHGNLSHP